jgi:hypothetical protein
MLMCIIPDDGERPPKYVSVIKKLYLYVYCMCKSSFFLKKKEKELFSA